MTINKDVKLICQVEIVVKLPADVRFKLFVHNKHQMYFPKDDEIFGSYYNYFDYGPLKKGFYQQTFTVSRTRWKTIDISNKRCDADTHFEPNTTECITHYLEEKIGCSMGLKSSNKNVDRLRETKIQ